MYRFYLYQSVIIFILLSVGSSCTRQSSYPIGTQKEEIFAQLSDEEIEIEVIYIGATPDYLIFETYIKNKSKIDLPVSTDHFSLHENESGSVIPPYETKEVISKLESQQKHMRKEKRKRTLLGVIVAGAGLLTNSISGVGIAENLWYNSESVAYVFDERRWIQRNIKSLDEEIQYIENNNLKAETILPGESITRDLLFPIKKYSGLLEVRFNHPRQDYILIFHSKDLLPQ